MDEAEVVVQRLDGERLRELGIPVPLEGFESFQPVSWLVVCARREVCDTSAVPSFVRL
jgi:hypothetical protein